MRRRLPHLARGVWPLANDLAPRQKGVYQSCATIPALEIK
jgi:hypothetical protein